MNTAVLHVVLHNTVVVHCIMWKKTIWNFEYYYYYSIVELLHVELLIKLYYSLIYFKTNLFVFYELMN